MPGLRPERLRAVALAGDMLLALTAWQLAGLLRVHVSLPLTAGLLPAERLALGPWVPALALAMLVIQLELFGLYGPGEPRPRVDLLLRVELAVVGSGIGIASALFVIDRTLPRSVVLLALALLAVVLPAWRLLLVALWRPRPRRVVVVGSGATAVELAQTIGERHWHGLVVVGHVPIPIEPPVIDPPVVLGPSLGTLGELPEILERVAADEVVLAASTASWKTELLDRLALARPGRSGVLLVPDAFESLVGRMGYRWVHDVPVIEVLRSGEWSPSRPLKRALDIFGACLLGLVALPVVLAAAALVKATSPGPAIYRQVRIGRDRVAFELLKLRTMIVDAEADGAERLASRGDARLTPIGRWLRRLRIDELPQLVNVLRGDMSLVGPRPERPGFVATYLVEVPGYGERFVVRPGVTGLAQVVGDYHTSAANKLRYELAYIANQSLALDLSILLRTVRTVLSTAGT